MAMKPPKRGGRKGKEIAGEQKRKPSSLDEEETSRRDPESPSTLRSLEPDQEEKKTPKKEKRKHQKTRGKVKKKKGK